ncbi:hypothetical protein ZHAS_00022252 [Anopheles sinensis]|uniref:Uncharacterized protein n=1 Tax=Anopheles sinensis TaxID=74873 RepID=A0A084WUV5_ANOSI|nr:hypothetical protein ZHAS_00022252 [Anopheles sinensis]
MQPIGGTRGIAQSNSKRMCSRRTVPMFRAVCFLATSEEEKCSTVRCLVRKG